MNDNDLATEFAKLIPLPPRRYRSARLQLARQMALHAAGVGWQAYFAQHQGWLIEDAGAVIRTNPRFYRYQNAKIGRAHV